MAYPPASLLGLPRELRDEIYVLTFSPRPTPHDYHAFLGLRLPDSDIQLAPLHAVNHQIRCETKCFYASATFRSSLLARFWAPRSVKTSVSTGGIAEEWNFEIPLLRCGAYDGVHIRLHAQQLQQANGRLGERQEIEFFAKHRDLAVKSDPDWHLFDQTLDKDVSASLELFVESASRLDSLSSGAAKEDSAMVVLVSRVLHSLVRRMQQRRSKLEIPPDDTTGEWGNTRKIEMRSAPSLNRSGSGFGHKFTRKGFGYVLDIPISDLDVDCWSEVSVLELENHEAQSLQDHYLNKWKPTRELRESDRHRTIAAKTVKTPEYVEDWTFGHAEWTTRLP